MVTGSMVFMMALRAFCKTRFVHTLLILLMNQPDSKVQFDTFLIGGITGL